MEKSHSGIGFVPPFVFRAENVLSGRRLCKALSAEEQLTLRLEQGESWEGQLLDTFENHLLQQGRVLVYLNGTLLLFNLASAAVLEQEAVAGWRFAGDLPPGELAKALAAVSTLRAFVPLGRISFHMDRGTLLDDEKKTLARLRMVTFNRGKKSLTFGVTAPLRGYGPEHARLVQLLQGCGAIKNNGITDLYRSLGVRKHSYTAKPKVALGEGLSAREAALAIITTFLGVARQNEAGVIEDLDSEFLHDYRVSLRKIRSLLSLFKGVFPAQESEELKAQFAGLMAPTGALRDLDVYLLERAEYRSMVPESARAGVERLFLFFEKERQEALQEVVASLRSRAVIRLKASLEKRFRSGKKVGVGPKGDLPARQYGAKLIYKRYGKVCRIAAEIDSTTPDEEVHQLRINCKKLRYLMEFFAPLYPKAEMGSLIKSLKRLQDNLGTFNDCSVQQQFLRTIVETRMNAFAGDQVEVSQAIGALTAMLHRRQLAERRQVEKNFAIFDSPEVRALFQQLFSSKGGKK